MPGPSVGAVTGSVPDVASMALGLSEAMAPEKGFAYNLCTFRIDVGEPEQGQPATSQNASLATPPSGSNPAPAASTAIVGTERRWHVGHLTSFFAIRNGQQAVVEVKILSFYAPSARASKSIIGVVVLDTLKGFDTAIGDNVAIEVSAIEQTTVPHGVILVIKGVINSTGPGFAHFIGAGFMRVETEGFGAGTMLVHEPLWIDHTESSSFTAKLLSLGEAISTRKRGHTLELIIE